MINSRGVDEIAAVFFWLADHVTRFDDDFGPEDADFPDFETAREYYFGMVDDPAMNDSLITYRKNAVNWIAKWGGAIE